MAISMDWYRSVSIAAVLTTSLFLIGFLKSMDIRYGESLYGTGITPELLLAGLQFFTLYAIYKKKL